MQVGAMLHRKVIVLLLVRLCAALRPTLNLGVTAKALVDTYAQYRAEASVAPLEEFVAAAVAAFRDGCALDEGCPLDVVHMEVDLAEDDTLAADRAARRDWLRTVRCTLDSLNDDKSPPIDALAERVTNVVAEASAHGLQLDRRIAAAPVDEEASAVPVDHLVLLTLRAWCHHEGEENEPGAT